MISSSAVGGVTGGASLNILKSSVIIRHTFPPSFPVSFSIPHTPWVADTGGKTLHELGAVLHALCLCGEDVKSWKKSGWLSNVFARLRGDVCSENFKLIALTDLALARFFHCLFLSAFLLRHSTFVLCFSSQSCADQEKCKLYVLLNYSDRPNIIANLYGDVLFWYWKQSQRYRAQ